MCLRKYFSNSQKSPSLLSANVGIMVLTENLSKIVISGTYPPLSIPKGGPYRTPDMGGMGGEERSGALLRPAAERRSTARAPPILIVAINGQAVEAGRSIFAVALPGVRT